MPRAFNKGEHPVLSYVQLRIYKISKNVAGPNIEFVIKDKIENKLLKMFNVQLFGNSYLSRWEWDDWAWAEEMRVRENGGDQHFLKLTLSLPTSAHCSLPTTSAHFILAKLSKLPGFPCNCEWKTLAWYQIYSFYSTKMHKAERVRFPFPDYHKSPASASSTEHYKYCLTKFVLSFYFLRRGLFMKRVLSPLLLVRTIIFLRN